jgi:hypothetical protein
MKSNSTIFLQGVIIFIGILFLGLMIRFPLHEGRAEHIDLLSIYTDPFILYIYATSIPLIIALYKTFKLIGYIRQNEAFSINSLNALKNIKHCAIVLGSLIVLAGIYIKLFHNKNDDPAGFLTLCFVSIIVSLTVATFANVFENILQNGINLKLEIKKLCEE